MGLMFGRQIYGKFYLTAEAQRMQREFLCILCDFAVRKKKYLHRIQTP
jgi:hypothetical protein